MREISFLTAFFFLLSFEGSAQIASPLNLDKIEKKITSSEGDTILKYFMNEAYKHQQIIPVDTNGTQKSIQIDNLFPKIKKDITDFIDKYKRDPLQEIDSSKRELVRPIFKIIETISKIANRRNVSGMPIGSDQPIQYNPDLSLAIDYEGATKTKLKEAFDLITVLPNSKEKIWLTLQYLNVDCDCELSKKIRSNCLIARDSADNIIDLFEKGMAYMYIGDFAEDRNLKDIAISMYYSAMQYFYFSNRDGNAKNYEQGLIYEKIAKVFDGRILQSWIRITQSKIKACKYYMSAAEHFKNAKYYSKYNENISKYLLGMSSISFQIEYYDNDTMLYYKTKANILKQLETWYHDFVSEKDGITKTGFMGFSSIGTILNHQGDIEESKYYFLSALIEAIKNQNIDDIYKGLYDISFLYTLLEKKDLAIAYANLAISITNNAVNRDNYYESLSNKAYIFLQFEKYDSALVYANKARSAVPQILVQLPKSSGNPDPLVYESEPFSVIQEFTCFLKEQIFTALKSDSASEYSLWHEGWYRRHLNEFAQLLQVESDAMTTWLDSTKSKEFDTEKNQRIKVEALNQKISDRNTSLWVSAIALTILLGILLVTYYNSKSKSKKLLKSKTSDLKLRSAIKNHNLGNHYAKIKVMLRENRLEDAVDYCEANSMYFNSYYKALLNERVTLKEEIDNFKSFIETEKIFKEKEIEIIYTLNNINIDKTIFLTDVLAPLYENVLLKGFTKNRSDYHFVIEVKNVENIIYCKIYDNGEGTKNIELEIRENSYLDMLRKRLSNYFEIQNIPIDEKKVFEISSKVSEGTVITFKLPYETI